eukprot:gnl/TRDRNA2_/TRDRNA2_71639_c0_seq1.p2 gnl/TRDRNA2_/TRDRNA2_71639_c0~~gnl/TRDRNA2_/TRDRNA2_71639_c0_seq1.p2  ORF type:complete len:139 (+),score=15.79 gnl/TRDRNA2_/TRDRNA2_71639_c0_seq1:74-490(+)
MDVAHNIEAAIETAIAQLKPVCPDNPQGFCRYTLDVSWDGGENVGAFVGCTDDSDDLQLSDVVKRVVAALGAGEAPMICNYLMSSNVWLLHWALVRLQEDPQWLTSDKHSLRGAAHRSSQRMPRLPPCVPTTATACHR